MYEWKAGAKTYVGFVVYINHDINHQSSLLSYIVDWGHANYNSRVCERSDAKTGIEKGQKIRYEHVTYEICTGTPGNSSLTYEVWRSFAVLEKLKQLNVEILDIWDS